MSTSQDIITSALSLILNDDATSTPSSADSNFALVVLIYLLDHLQLDPQNALGLKEYIYTPATGTQSITIGSALSVTLTSSSTTATATTTNPHSFLAGDIVVIAGAAQTEYNGTYTIVSVTSTTFTYTFAGSVTSPATGTITASPNVVMPMPQRLEEASFCRLGGVDFLIGFAASYEEYNAQPVKSNQGYPTKCWLNRDEVSQVARLYLWPASNGAELHLQVRQVPLNGFASMTLSTTLTLGMGQQKLLIDILAAEMLDSYNVPQPAYTQIQRKAANSLRKWKRSNLKINILQMPVSIGRYTMNSYTA